MLLIGCSPAGRHIEQHDVFFGVGDSIKDVLPQAINFWPEAKKTFHLDAWRAVTKVGSYQVSIVEQTGADSVAQLFFINLGGYKKNEFEEFHYKLLAVAANKNEALMQAKKTAFFKHTGFKGANAHIDDKYGIDVDDFFAIRDILPADIKARFSLVLSSALPSEMEDELHLGYFRPEKVDNWGASED